MAAVAEQESETQLCSNCQKEIPLANFTMHEIHCSRNIGVCPVCKESFPKSEMKSHQELEHTQVTCKCSMKMDRGVLQEHVTLECPLRRVACQHCDLELAFNQLQEHEDYCGARTERCARCSRNVMLKDLKEHPEDCGERAKEEGVAPAKPCLNSGAALRDLQAIRSLLQAGDALPRTNRGLESSRLYNCLSEERQPREPNKRSVTPAHLAQNPGSLEKVTNTQLLIGQEPDSDSDYLLAVSLQRGNSSRERSAAEVQRELWKDFCPGRTRPAEEDSSWSYGSPFFSQGFSADAPNKPKVETLLPCEFCEELYPEEDLILHQTGCNPASALASFSKFSASASRHDRDECLMDLWEQLQSSQSTGYRERRPLQQDVGGSLMLPCEFCGVQLEEDILFHHQDQCDLRPATASLTGQSQSQQEPPESGEGMEAPALPKSRTQHPGEASPQCLEEEFRQKRPPLSSQGGLVRESPVATNRSQLTSPSSRRENSVGCSERGKLQERGSSSGRAPRRGTSSPVAVAAALPARQSTPSSYVPSFPVTAPVRPSLRGEAGQRVTLPARGNSTKAKPWQNEADYPGQQ
ncbi:TRAF-type zinc finger domain-containing protein 1 isoform X2 [Tiliqua scincoides]|uniref:TRAF-type zinc finger domain-containing protein 1 isoform X2 n=1 Tax=Tiliqua scincoides TaxID=71010 RepID=UPI003461BCED